MRRVCFQGQHFLFSLYFWHLFTFINIWLSSDCSFFCKGGSSHVEVQTIYREAPFVMKSRFFWFHNHQYPTIFDKYNNITKYIITDIYKYLEISIYNSLQSSISDNIYQYLTIYNNYYYLSISNSIQHIWGRVQKKEKN